jgi:general secretion pathway protein I
MAGYYRRPSSIRRAAEAQRGFTLVEVLVALAVLGIALAAVLHTIGQSIDVATGLRARTLALWVAQERAVEHRLRGEWPEVDTTDGTMIFAGDEWRWRERVTSNRTPFGETRRIDIEVRGPDSPDVLARLALFFSRP